MSSVRLTQFTFPSTTTPRCWAFIGPERRGVQLSLVATPQSPICLHVSRHCYGLSPYQTTSEQNIPIAGRLASRTVQASDVRSSKQQRCTYRAGVWCSKYGTVELSRVESRTSSDGSDAPKYRLAAATAVVVDGQIRRPTEAAASGGAGILRRPHLPQVACRKFITRLRHRLGREPSHQSTTYRLISIALWQAAARQARAHL